MYETPIGEYTFSGKHESPWNGFFGVQGMQSFIPYGAGHHDILVDARVSKKCTSLRRLALEIT